MIDLGLTKLMVIGVVALIVIGPEKLPKVARMAGSLFGRAQRYLNEVKSEVSREMELDEMHKLRTEMEEAVGKAQQTVAQSMSQVESEMSSTWHEVADAGAAGSINPVNTPATTGQLAAKAKDFRKKKLARNSALPAWYKHKTGHKTRVISGAARVARYRPASSGKSSFSYY